MTIKKLLASIFMSLLFIAVSSVPVSANDFLIEDSVDYRLDENGKAVVTHTIKLKNTQTALYATSYSLHLSKSDPKDVTAHDADNKLPVKVEANDQETKITVDFPDPLIGSGRERGFVIQYHDSTLATKNGEVWQVVIPKVEAGSYEKYTVTLSVPLSFGATAYSDPEADSESVGEKRKELNYGKTSAQNGIMAVFGEFQVFSFDLTYHLENPLNKSTQVEIAVPPDTAYQRINFGAFNPEPVRINVDEDGNWLAVYELTSRQRLDVNVKGTAQLFSDARSFPRPNKEVLNKNLKSTKYWQTEDTRIKILAEKLQTPKAIYDYLASTFKYDYERVRPNTERIGAAGALQNPQNAICMEYTDAFVALSRAAGIPAREVNGYAYTENPEIQPLSLVSDVLHAWPEYWDENRGVWVPVDPTWGSTTGSDYFSMVDLRHVTFVNHGVDDTKPFAPGSYKLGANPQKDVYVSFGTIPKERSSTPALELEGGPFYGIKNITHTVLIENPGPVALYDLEVNTEFDGKREVREVIAILPPRGIKEVEVKIPVTLLGNNSPDSVTVAAQGQVVNVPAHKPFMVTASMTAIFSSIIAILLPVYLKAINKRHGKSKSNKSRVS